MYVLYFDKKYKVLILYIHVHFLLFITFRISWWCQMLVYMIQIPTDIIGFIAMIFVHRMIILNTDITMMRFSSDRNGDFWLGPYHQHRWTPRQSGHSAGLQWSEAPPSLVAQVLYPKLLTSVRWWWLVAEEDHFSEDRLAQLGSADASWKSWGYL